MTADARRQRSASCRCTCRSLPTTTSRARSPASAMRASKGAQLVCLPELFRSRYFCQSESNEHFALAEAVPGPTTERAGAARGGTGHHADREPVRAARAGAVSQHRGGARCGRADTSASIARCTSRTIRGTTRNSISRPATSASRRFRLSVGNVGVLVCWDQWYPEAARLTALAGAEMLFYPTAIGWHPEERAEVNRAQHDAWETAQRAHAIANGCYVVAVNRTGFEPDPAGQAAYVSGARASLRPLTDPSWCALPRIAKK